MAKKIIRVMCMVLMVFIGIFVAQNSRVKSQEKEEVIYYSNFLEGIWESKGIVSFCYNPLSYTSEDAKALLGTRYSFNVEEYSFGGLIPIRDSKEQDFFLPQYYVSLEEPVLSGEYYAIISSENAKEPLLFVKNENTIYLEENLYGIFELHQITTGEGLEIRVYDRQLSFEENIKQRMEVQGFDERYYYPTAWTGEWKITDIVYAENKEEAMQYIGKSVSYRTAAKFDLHFPASPQERVFYNMPTVEELGLTGEYYVLTWSEASEFQAAIVMSEGEIFFIKDNIILKAIQEEPYYEIEDFQAL